MSDSINPSYLFNLKDVDVVVKKKPKKLWYTTKRARMEMWKRADRFLLLYDARTESYQNTNFLTTVSFVSFHLSVLSHFPLKPDNSQLNYSQKFARPKNYVLMGIFFRVLWRLSVIQNPFVDTISKNLIKKTLFGIFSTMYFDN